MRRVDGGYKFDKHGEELLGFFVGKNEIIHPDFDGCDWKENPAKIVNKLTKRICKKYSHDTHELVEVSDGSDALWYAIIPRKVSKSKVKRKLRK